MYKDKSIIAIIPARGGSKGIKRKNLQLVGDKPLVAWSIEDALKSELVDAVVVSSEDEEILKVAREFGDVGDKVILRERPKELAEDQTQTEPVMIDALETLRMTFGKTFDYVVLLEPTGLFRRKSDIDNAIKQIIDEQADSLLSVFQNDVFLWEEGWCRNKDIPWATYKGVPTENSYATAEPVNYDYQNRPTRQQKVWEWVENDALFITKTDLLMKEKCRLGGKIVLYKMPEFISSEIDEPFDLIKANWLITLPEVREELQK